MRVLTKLEQREFDKTFNFLNHWIGSAYWYDNVNSLHDLRFDGKRVNLEIFEMINNKFKGSLKVVNHWFCDVNKDKMMEGLIRIALKIKCSHID